MILRLLDVPVSLALWPPALAHEATHLAAGYRWLDSVNGYDLHPLRGAFVDVDLVDDAPRWARATVATAPTLVGTAFAASAMVLLIVGGGSWPASTAETGRWLLIGAWWLVYTAPSKADLKALPPGERR